MRSPRPRYVLARDYARRHGWRESAVIHRIQAGIYDGEQVDGEWYVLRGSVSTAAARGSDSDTVRRPRRRLPWYTVPGPLAWVGWTAGGCMAAALGSFFGILGLDLTDHPASLPWIAFLMVLFFLVLTVEAVQTGVVRSRSGLRSYAEMPVRFVFHLVLYGLLTLASAAFFLRMIVLALRPV